MKELILLLFVFSNCCLRLQAQSPVVSTPQPWTFPRVAVGGDSSAPKTLLHPEVFHYLL